MRRSLRLPSGQPRVLPSTQEVMRGSSASGPFSLGPRLSPRESRPAGGSSAGCAKLRRQRPQEKPSTQGHWASARTKGEEGISRMAGPSAATQGRARPSRPSVCPTPSLWAARLGTSRSTSTGVRPTAQAGVPRGRGQPHGTRLSVPEDKAQHLPHGT